MRAKEYLEINKSEILYYDIVKSAIDALCPLRINKRETEEYFNRYLFSDARFLANEKGFVLNEGEVDFKLAQDVRTNIMNAVCQDESYIFTYNIIVMQNNEYHNLTPLKFCKLKDFNSNTVSKIENICSLYKEDYPKNNLMSYLLDDDNSVYYYKAQAELNKREKWWLDVFNEAYSIFDKMRLLLHKPFEAKQLITQYKNEDKDFENTLVDVVLYLVSMYKYDLTLKQEKAIDLLSKIIYQYFSRIKRTSYVDKINDLENVLKEKEEEYLRIIKIKEEDSESEIDKLNNEIDKLKSENDRLKEKDANVMPCSQQAMAFIYLLNLIGINTENTKKSIIARFVHRITGRNEANIRKRLEFDYDDVNVKQNLRIVAEAFSEILPSTTEQILKDINA